MRLTHMHEVGASVEAMYAAFTDPQRIGRCFPGAEVPSVDGDDFTGHLRTRVGPITLTYAGTGRMTARDPEQHSASLEASGRERHGLGWANMASTVRLEPVGSDRTTVHLVTTIEVFGAPVDLGGGIAQRVSEPLVERFMRAMAGEPGSSEESELDVARSVMSGLLHAGRSFGRLRRRH